MVPGRNRTSIEGSKGPRLAVRRPRTGPRLCRVRRRTSRRAPTLEPRRELAGVASSCARPMTEEPLPLITAPSAPASRSRSLAVRSPSCRAKTGRSRSLNRSGPSDPASPEDAAARSRSGSGPVEAPSSSHHRYASGERTPNPNRTSTQWNVATSAGARRSPRPAIRTGSRQHGRYVRADPLADLLERRRIHVAPLQRVRERGRGIGAPAPETRCDRDALVDPPPARRPHRDRRRRGRARPRARG